jgi:predicted DNA-binding transcriptional regulator AlpA
MDNPFQFLNEALLRIESRLNKIESYFHRNEFNSNGQVDTWLDLNELCAYLPDKPAKATIYGYVNARLIPYHKGQKKLRFLKSEIDGWLKSGVKKTVIEISDEVNTFLKPLKSKNKF